MLSHQAHSDFGHHLNVFHSSYLPGRVLPLYLRPHTGSQAAHQSAPPLPVRTLLILLPTLYLNFLTVYFTPRTTAGTAARSARNGT